MAFTTLILEDKNKVVKRAPVGYSWSGLFFWPFVAIIRGAWLHLFVVTLSIFICGLFGLVGLASAYIVMLLIFPFIYNRIYLESLIKKGFKPKKYVAIYFGRKRISKKEELLLIRKKAAININNLSVIPIYSDEVDKISKIYHKIRLIIPKLLKFILIVFLSWIISAIIWGVLDEFFNLDDLAIFAGFMSFPLLVFLFYKYVFKTKYFCIENHGS